MTRPAIAVTMGDPAGVGPEICLKALADPRVGQVCAPVIVGSAAVLAKASQQFGLPMPAHILSPGDFTGHVFAIFIITIAAAEVAIGLGILLALFNRRGIVDASEMNLLKW